MKFHKNMGDHKMEEDDMKDEIYRQLQNAMDGMSSGKPEVTSMTVATNDKDLSKPDDMKKKMMGGLGGGMNQMKQMEEEDNPKPAPSASPSPSPKPQAMNNPDEEENKDMPGMGRGWGAFARRGRG